MNSVECSKAQDLLVKLVQALTPLTLKEGPVSFFPTNRFFLPISKDPILLLSLLQKEVNHWVGEGSAKEFVEPPKKTLPIASQAKHLIAQVQQAIGKLATSEFMQSPKEAPLKEVLKKLKPNLDQIINNLDICS